MNYYHKIQTLFERDLTGTKKLVVGTFASETYEMLKDVPWIFTEKIDGTNIGVVWDGQSVSYIGRTERSNIPPGLIKSLDTLFKGEDVEQIFEQMFGDKKVILFGEGYGGKIQNGLHYRDVESFILFDVYFTETDLWAKRDVVEAVAKSLNIDVVPVVLVGTLMDAVAFVQSSPTSNYSLKTMEGVIGKPVCELKDNQGKRIITKIKVADFK